MLKIYSLACLALFLVSATSLKAQKGKIPIVDFEQLEPVLHQQDDTLYVVNFWATWCGPCVKELPYFEQVAAEYKDRKFKLILVSLDFPTNYERRLIPFVEKKVLTGQVILLDDPDANAWINKVSPKWSGAIPATLIFRNGQRQFYEQSFDYAELKEAIKPLIE